MSAGPVPPPAPGAARATAADAGLQDVELVLVAYRSRAHVAQLLTDLPPDVRLVVVDNSDGSDGLPELVRQHPGGRYLSGGGVGFARAANLGARTSTAGTLVFVKPATRPATEDLASLVADVVTDPGCAASAGTLVHEDGTAQLGVGGWDPSLLRALVHALGLHKLVPRAGIFARPAMGRPVRLHWVNGGCMAVRRETFLRLGGFDEDFYLFNDDVAFGRACREHGLTQRLRTDIAVLGQPGGSGAPSLEMWRLRGASLARYLRKYRPGIRAELAIAVLAAGHAARAGVSAARRRGPAARELWAQCVGLATGRGYVGDRLVMTRWRGGDD